MNADELRKIMDYLTDRVHLSSNENAEPTAVVFTPPKLGEMVSARLNEDLCRQVLTAPWWDEMVQDILETPDICEADDPPERVLEYAKDVVSEYMRKRVRL